MKGYDILLSSQKKSKFWIHRPHEGPEEYEFELVSVNFSDGITRFIFKSEIVPEDYWPRMVYILNTMTGCYECVGNYEYEYEYEKKVGGRDGYRFVAL